MAAPILSEKAWSAADDDDSAQLYIRVTADALDEIYALRTAPHAVDEPGLRSQVTALQQLLGRMQDLTYWSLDALADTRVVQNFVAGLTQERDRARNSEARLQQQLTDAEVVINHLSGPEAPTVGSSYFAGMAADPGELNGPRGIVESF